ncbi:peroxisomal sarcosine oxidase-like isoform X2 [Centruroides vittatus]|uniref:peroxisomal sarcosine oxidase-like isoform X2 n=1 Tax=Centruroides vittatus TaxID=120091 RepID=UPI00350F2854
MAFRTFSAETNRGGSSGFSRLIRYSYEEPYFAQLMPEAYQIWKEIEEQSQKQVIVQTGLIMLDKKPSNSLKKCCENVKNVTTTSLKELNDENMQEKYPQFLFNHDYIKFYEETGGIILANKALSAVQELFIKNGGKFYCSEKVCNIKPGKIITIETETKSFQTPSLIICAGPWTNKILKFLDIQVPIKTPKVRVYYWKERENTGRKFPSFIDLNGIGTHVYGFQALEYPNHVKICAHGGDECDPDAKDTTGMKDIYVDKLCKYIQQHFPEIEYEKPNIIETCIYSDTPDNTFILDYHPSFKNIVIGCGFSGTGFKTSPIIGKILGNLALNHPISYNLEPFLISRFKNM